MPSKRKQNPTIRDVAVLANVSVSTASRALTQHPDVGEETRDRVLNASKELGYRPSLVARSLLSGTTMTIGLLVSDIANPFYPQLAKAVEETAGYFGYTVILCNTEDNPEQTRRYIERLISQGVDGIIHASVSRRDEEILEIAFNAGLPVVIANRRPCALDTVDMVVSDNLGGAEAAVNHLLSLGHRRIAHIGGPQHLVLCDERLEGYRRALVNARIPYDSELVSHGPITFESGGERAREIVNIKPRVTAIFALNDIIALGVFDTLLRIGMHVPRDMAIVGFDDIDFSKHHPIQLTSVAQNIPEIGRKATELLIDAISNPEDHKPQQIVLETKLMIRRTSSQTIEDEDLEQD